eukprot:4915107-Pleurochrysis_carterae.AAC.1
MPPNARRGVLKIPTNILEARVAASVTSRPVWPPALCASVANRSCALRSVDAVKTGTPVVGRATGGS